ncbi:hypothetical protein BJ138DRAFT_455175 [Hygrophoropsis aurantiaca]|uniref:Uncharacterized protein n=1 Tax=Hygrophoropsis aurantiaca TaxID=72124 RepID=A0ACB8A3X9_9AGAM|nr:hypothetical protein BJ138DRAFT_455175 [Hygrophoropsis aurantiaca]
MEPIPPDSVLHTARGNGGFVASRAEGWAVIFVATSKTPNFDGLSGHRRPLARFRGVIILLGAVVRWGSIKSGRKRTVYRRIRGVVHACFERVAAFWTWGCILNVSPRFERVAAFWTWGCILDMGLYFGHGAVFWTWGRILDMEPYFGHGAVFWTWSRILDASRLLATDAPYQVYITIYLRPSAAMHDGNTEE